MVIIADVELLSNDDIKQLFGITTDNGVLKRMAKLNVPRVRVNRQYHWPKSLVQKALLQGE